MKKTIIILVLLLAITSICTFAANHINPFLWQSFDKRGEIIKQPNGPFKVMLFDYDAQGCYIGVVYSKMEFGPVDDKWSYSNCFWQDATWCSNITSFAWSHDGKYLYVGTSSVYGDGRVFKLDLHHRKARPIYPQESDMKTWKAWEYFETNINAIDLRRDTLTVEAKTDQEIFIKKIKMR